MSGVGGRCLNSFFFPIPPVPASGFWEWEQGGQVLGRIPHGLKYPPVQHRYNRQAPLLPPLPTLT